jgi:predicted aspartyl protease
VTVPFNAQQGLVRVGAELAGPSGTVLLQLALDTGATRTLIAPALVVAAGYDPALAPNRVQITIGSGMEFVPLLVVNRLTALGKSQSPFTVLCHTLPPSAGIDGVLGLDFLRGLTLTIDFRSGQITLT